MLKQEDVSPHTMIVQLKIQTQETCLGTSKEKTMSVLSMLPIWELTWEQILKEEAPLFTKYLCLIKEQRVLMLDQVVIIILNRYPRTLEKCLIDGTELTSWLSQNLINKTLLIKDISWHITEVKSHVRWMKFANQTLSTLIQVTEGFELRKKFYLWPIIWWQPNKWILWPQKKNQISNIK